MPEFLRLRTADEARGILAGFDPVGAETCALHEADDRVVALDVAAEEDVPPWPRATMDGYAVRARETFGASETVPAFLTVAGQLDTLKASA